MLHHLALGAHDVERVATFWRDALGLREHTRHVKADGSVRSIWLSLTPESVLMIEHTTHPLAPLSSPEIGAGFFLLAITVSADEHEAIRQRLDLSGHAIEDATSYTSYLRDPEGNRAAISHYPLARDPLS